MKSRYLIGALILVIASAGIAVAGETVAEQTFRYSGHCPEDGTLSVDVSEELVTLSAWDDEHLRIDAVIRVVAPDSWSAKKARRMASHIELRVRREDGTIAVSTVYPRACDKIECSVTFEVFGPEGLTIATAAGP